MSLMGSISTESGLSGHVRFTPVSDRTADIAGGPVGANNGLMQRCIFDEVRCNA
jgi:hypothetical protein